MQINDKIQTYFTDEGYWILSKSEITKALFSKKILDICNNLSINHETLLQILDKVIDGKWPILLGGKLFITSTIQISKNKRIISMVPSTKAEVAEILQTNTGDDIFILITANSRIIAYSKTSETLFNKETTISKIFDSISTSSIRAAISHCLQNDSTPDFIVSYRTKKMEKQNCIFSIRKLPTIGNLFYCRLTKPSVALISQSSLHINQIKSILENSPIPSIILDSTGVIIALNEIARNISSDIWGEIPLNINFVNFVHHSQKTALDFQYKDRIKNSITETKYTIKLRPSSSNKNINAEITVVPISDTNQHIVYLNIINFPDKQNISTYDNDALAKINQLFLDKSLSQVEVLEIAAKALNATAAAYSKERNSITVGDSRQLIEMLDPIHLAASPPGFRDDGIFIHRIHSGFGISHFIFQNIPNLELNQTQIATLEAVSKIFSEREAWQALQSVYKILSTVKSMAKVFLNKTESLENLLSDLSNDCRAESAAIFRISADGLFLRGIAASGIVGKLPELPLESLNSATWACIKGETTFFSEVIGTELQFSPVFLTSKSELAVPFHIGNSPDGVILLTSTNLEAFNYSETELIELMGLLFTVSTNLNENKVVEETQALNMLKQKALEYMIHTITSLGASATQVVNSMVLNYYLDSEIHSNVKFLSETTTKLGYFSKWALWWLKISVYGGKPEPKWLDPTALLENSLHEFKLISEEKQIKLYFYPPENDIDVCTDSSFINMIAHSLLVCLIEYCANCKSISLSVKEKKDYWTFSFETLGGSIPSKCYAVQKVPEKYNMAYTLAWKLIEEMGGTINTLSNTGKSTKIMIRFKQSG